MSIVQRPRGGQPSNLMTSYGSALHIQQESMHDADFEEAARLKWTEVTDRLLDWWPDTTPLEDEGATAPSQEVIETALRVAGSMRERRMSPPARVVPTNDGGICFERWASDAMEVLEFLPDGTGELREFIGGRLMTRQSLQLGKDNSA